MINYLIVCFVTFFSVGVKAQDQVVVLDELSTEQLNADITSQKWQNFITLLIGEEENNNPIVQNYNKEVKAYKNFFQQEFINPMVDFQQKNLDSYDYGRVFYPFAGPDASYPLLLFPKSSKYVLIGMEFPGNPETVISNFKIHQFQVQLIEYLQRGFFKTMNMSAQMHYEQGVIPIILTQIGLVQGKIYNIESISHPLKGIIVKFMHNSINKELIYFRGNLDDSSNKDNLFAYLEAENMLSNCMLKASSYKLQQPEFKQLRKFMHDKCQLFLQDDTGMPVKLLMQENRAIHLFGNYVRPYGSEFNPYYQKELAYLYQKNQKNVSLNFCFGYGCKKVEANILLSTKK